MEQLFSVALSLPVLQREPAVHRWVALRCPDFPSRIYGTMVRASGSTKVQNLMLNAERLRLNAIDWDGWRKVPDLILKEYFGGAVAKTRVVLVDEMFHFPPAFQQVVYLIAQLAGTYAVYNNQ